MSLKLLKYGQQTVKTTLNNFLTDEIKIKKLNVKQSLSTSNGCVGCDDTDFGILGSERTDFLLVVRDRVRPCDVTDPDLSLRVVVGRGISSSVSDSTSRGRLTFSIRLWYSLRFSLLTRSAIFLFLSLNTWCWTSSINFLCTECIFGYVQG